MNLFGKMEVEGRNVVRKELPQVTLFILVSQGSQVKCPSHENGCEKAVLRKCNLPSCAKS